MKPSDLGLPSRFREFRRYAGFDQLATATELALATERFQISNLPTGAGKSLTAVTAAHLRGGRFLVLTGTKNLESQYLDDGLVQARVHSHRNYRCAATASRNEAADADDPEFRCAWPRQQCLHHADVEAVRRSRGSVTNYAYWLSIARYSDPDLIGAFDYLILDEAHSAPTWLVDALTVTITASRISRVLGISRPQIPQQSTHPTIDKYADWLDRLTDAGVRRLREVEERSEVRKIERLLADIAFVRCVPDLLATGEYKERWVVAHLADSTSPGVAFIPRWGSDFAERYLFRNIPHVLLTSATVTPDHARYLGIPDCELRYREAPSPFDPRRRPIVYIPTTRVDFRMSESARWKLYRQIDDLIEAAIDQRAGNGIIHTGSYERNAELVRSLERYSAVVITHRKDARDFNAQFQRFVDAGRRGQFAVFASPRIQEGVNLPGSLCRWQVIMKALAPIDMRDPLMKARCEDPKYRNLLTAEAFKQMCGRPVRGEQDFATTIVLDDHWKHARRDCPFEGWFRQAFQELKPGQHIQFLTQEIVDGFAPMRARAVEMIG